MTRRLRSPKPETAQGLDSHVGELVAPIRNFRTISEQLQDRADALLDQLAPTEWDENHISLSLVKCIREVLGQPGDVHGPHELLRLDAEIYKVTGAPERAHGDIAVVVRHAFRGQSKFDGTAFYEAKAADENGRFPAFKFPQLRRLVRNSPRLTMLLYERTPQKISADPLWEASGGIESDDSPGSYVRTRAVGASLMLSQHRHPEDVAAFYSEPFGSHFVSRYLSGKDLDYSMPPQRRIQKWLSDTKRAPPIVVGLTVALTADHVEPLWIPGYEMLPPEPRPVRELARANLGMTGLEAPEKEPGFPRRTLKEL